MKSLRLALPALSLALAIGCAAPAPTQPGASATPSAAPSAALPDAGSSPTTGTAALQGQVHDDDLLPMAGVMIRALQGGETRAEATTDPEGRYSLSLPAGAYVIQASKAQFVTREQALQLSGPVTLDFGGQNSSGGNPYFLASQPEIVRTEVTETAPGGPFELKIHLSEPLTVASRKNFADRLELQAPGAEPFLRPGIAIEPYLETQSEWDANGQVFTLRYAQPYLAGETYTLKLRQRSLDKLDPVTRLPAYEKMEIVDAAGEALGHDRADFAFLRPVLQTIGFQDTANKDLGFTPAIRRWNLTHTGAFDFQSAADTTGPGLTSVRVNALEDSNGALHDVMELRFTEPMRVVKDRNTDQYTRLDRNKSLFVLNVSTAKDGANPKALSSSITNIKFSRLEPDLVLLYFPSGTFKDQKWVEVTLDGDLRDPAGNKADPAKSRVAGSVG